LDLLVHFPGFLVPVLALETVLVLELVQLLLAQLGL
jgi:hypothetical protein